MGVLARIALLLVVLGLGVLLGMAASNPADPPRGSVDDSGGIELVVDDAAVERRPAVAKVLDRADLQSTIDQLDDELSLPETITVEIKDDPDEAYYDPEARRILLSPAYIADTMSSMRESYGEGDDAVVAAASSIEFTVLHELGHALVDVLELPITGLEETAVDQFAAVALVELLDDPVAVLEASDLFDWVSVEPEEADFYDEHALDQQRFFALRCLVYGTDPDEYADELDGLDLDEDRAELCVESSEQVFAAWETLLEPYR